jgi:hypothetical protein
LLDIIPGLVSSDECNHGIMAHTHGHECPDVLQGQVDTIKKVLELSWEVTTQTLAAGAASGGRGATTVIFAPVQGFFAVRTIAQLSIQVSHLLRAWQYQEHWPWVLPPAANVYRPVAPFT